MIIDLCRLAVKVLPACYLVVLIWMFVPESSRCQDYSLPYLNAPSDANVARSRAHAGNWFNFFTLLDFPCMLLVIKLSKLRQGSHDLRGIGIYISGFIMVSAIGIRGRRTFNTSSDPLSCERLNCPTEALSTTLPGCTGVDIYDTVKVDWRDRRSWCPVPNWYRESNAATLCGGLSNTPHVHACYTYGCTNVIPSRYNAVRLSYWLPLVFALCSLIPYEKVGQNNEVWKCKLKMH